MFLFLFCGWRPMKWIASRMWIYFARHMSSGKCNLVMSIECGTCSLHMIIIIISIGARINDISTPILLNVYQFTKDTSFFFGAVKCRIQINIGGLGTFARTHDSISCFCFKIPRSIGCLFWYWIFYIVFMPLNNTKYFEMLNFTSYRLTAHMH